MFTFVTFIHSVAILVYSRCARRSSRCHEGVVSETGKNSNHKSFTFYWGAQQTS